MSDRPPAFQSIPEPNRLMIGLLERPEPPIVVQRWAPDHRPYLHPLRPLDGAGVLTEDAPSHHPWQHGLYTGMHDVGASDFWFDQGQWPHAGAIETTRCTLELSEPQEVAWLVEATWRRHEDRRPLLWESQSWRLVMTQGTWRLELGWSLRAGEALSVHAHAYGGPFLRMPFREMAGCRVINATGHRDHECEQQPAAWVCVTMPIQGRVTPAGGLLSAHPTNDRAEPKWRVDGELGVGPVVVAEGLNFQPEQTRAWRFGFTCVTGEPPPQQCAALHHQYTQTESQVENPEANS